MTLLSVINLWPPFGGSVQTGISGPFDVAAMQCYVAGPAAAECYVAGYEESQVYVAGMVAGEVDN